MSEKKPGTSPAAVRFSKLEPQESHCSTASAPDTFLRPASSIKELKVGRDFL